MGKDPKNLPLFVISIAIFSCQWRHFQGERSLREPRREMHYVAKRHMLPREERRRLATTQRTKEIRKRPSVHLRPLNEDDIENDEVLSVAIGPSAARPKYDNTWKPPRPSNVTSGATNLVKDILVQLGQEFLTHKVSEDFVFGQYVGNAMKNLTKNLKLRMQHDILELIFKYQSMNQGGGTKVGQSDDKTKMQGNKDVKDREKKFSGNETEEGWPDFNNLAKIVG